MEIDWLLWRLIGCYGDWSVAMELLKVSNGKGMELLKVSNERGMESLKVSNGGL